MSTPTDPMVEMLRGMTQQGAAPQPTKQEPVNDPMVEFLRGQNTATVNPTSTDDPVADLLNNVELESDRNDITGFWPSMKAGFDNLYTSAVRVPAALLSEGVTQLVEEYSPELGQQMRADTDGFLRGPEGEKRDLAIAMERAANAPTSDTLRTLGRADDVDSFVSAFMDSNEKWTVVKEVLGLSLPSSLGLAASTMYGGLPATFVSSYVMDWGNSYVESRQIGKDHTEALLDASTKSLVQAGLDTAAMGVAGVQLHGNRMLNLLSQSTVQALAGGGAEWLKHEAVGEDTTTGQILIEGLAEFALGPLEVFSRNQDLAKREAAQKILKDYEEKMRLDPKEVAAVKAGEKLQKFDQELQKIIPPSREDFKRPTITDETGKPVGIDDLSMDEALAILPMINYQGLEDTFLETTDLTPYGDLLRQNLNIINDAGESISLKDNLFIPGTVYKYDEFAQLDQELIRLGLEKEQMQAQMEALPEAEQTLLKEQFTTLNETIDRLNTFKAEQQKLFTLSKGVLEEWMQKFGLKKNIVLTLGKATDDYNAFIRDNVEYSPERQKEFLPPIGPGVWGTDGFVRLIDKDTWLMGINPHSAMLENGTNKPKNSYTETLAHEFGHALMMSRYADLQPQQQVAVLSAYRKWLQRHSDGKTNYLDFLTDTRGNFTVKDFLGDDAAAGEDFKNLDVFNWLLRTGGIDYKLGMQEFLAHQFERLSNKKPMLNGIEKYFKDVLPELKTLHKLAKEDFNVEPDFDLFLKHLVATDTYNKLKSELTRQEQSRVDQTLDQRVKDRMNKIIKPITGFEDTSFKDDYNNALDSYNKMYQYGWGLTHLTKDNPHIKGLQRYTKAVKNWWNEKMSRTSNADETLKAWSKYVGLFNKDKKGDKFGKFLLELSVLSFDGKKRFSPTDPEFIRLASQYGVDEAGMELYLKIDKDFREALDAMEEGIVYHIERNFRDDPVELKAQQKKLAKEMADLRNRNFFPLTRFGKHYVHVKAAKKMKIGSTNYKIGETVSFTTFEKEKQAKKFYREKNKSSDYTVQTGVLSDFQQQFAGIPPDLISVVKDKLNLTDEQQKELNLFLTERAPGQSFKKHLLNRKQTSGYSQDAMRGYANYFMHFSNYIAKIKYSKVMDDAIGDVQKTIPYLAGDATKRQKIADHLNKHKEYILNPGNELANLRALGFLWYLGFVPKSAVVNLTQVPMVTYPYLAARYGDAEAVASLAKATKTFGMMWKNPEKVDIEIVSMLEELKKRGIIDESMATELAATAEGSVVQKFAPSWASNPRAHRIIRTAAGWGALMFQAAEKANRRVTAIAAFELAKKRGYGFEGALAQAEKAVEATQYEYARWNRPFFSQKKRSVFFLFWMYKTNALHFMFKDPGSSRYLAMLFLTAGLAGLPFAEDIMDMYDWMARKLNKQFGEDTAPPDIRLELRELMQAINANPDLMMHGASRYMFGMPAVADMVGVPLANADMSGSLSMGRMIPGIGGMFGQEGDFGETFSRGAEEMGGAVMAIPFSLMKAIADDNPDYQKRFERALPSFARNFSKAYRYWNEGADTTRGGGKLVEFDLQDWQHRAEIAQQFLGFSPTRAQVEKEKYWETKELGEYYAARRTLLMQDFDYARHNKDFEGEQYIREKIREYNKTVPIKGFRITGNDLLQSVNRREKERRLIERGRFTSAKGRALQQRIDQSFVSDEPPQEPVDPTIILEEILK